MAIKRIFDIFVSLFALIFFGPLMLLIALLVKITSKGPILYKQERMTRDGKSFMMWKFRSMRTDAEANGGAQWAVKNDPRTTKLGPFCARPPWTSFRSFLMC
jgi:lipopolysaccharide/colanic/teichoic acid biosynthesis glycosyltransferase